MADGLVFPGGGEVTHNRYGDANAFGNPAAELFVTPEDVLDHLLLENLIHLAQAADKIEHEVIALPLLDRTVPLTCLLVVVGAVDRLLQDLTGYVRTIFPLRFVGFDETSPHGWLVVDRRNRAAIVHSVGHLSIGLVGVDFSQWTIDRQLQVIRTDPMALRVAV